MYFPEIKARQEEIAEAHKSTFHWIFDDGNKGIHRWDNFVQWLERGHGIYWISGKAGSGKSTLMNYICEDSRTINSLNVWSGTTEILFPTFFFWNPGSAMQKSSVGLLRSLVYQILETFPHLIPMLAGSGKSESPPGPFTSASYRLKTVPAWTERRLQMTLQRIVRELTSSRLCFFIDGLDEFIGNYGALIEMIEDMIQNPNVKICVSSRPYRSFADAFGRFPKLKLQDLTEQDIRAYAADRLSSLSRTKLLVAEHPTWIRETVDKLLKKADGVFLWVRLAVDDQIEGAKDEDSAEELAKRLELLPSEMGDLYAHMLNKISKAHRKEAVRYLQLVLHGQNPNPSLLMIALAVYDKLDDLLSVSSETNIQDVIAHWNKTAKRIATTCAGFLEIFSGSSSDKQNNFSGADLERELLEEQFHVSFLHRTTSDFLLEDERGKKFSDMNSTMNFDPYTLYIRAELGVLIIFAASHHFSKRTPKLLNAFGEYVDSVMASAYHAEEKTSVARIALMDHVDTTIAKLVERYDNEGPLLHWCTRRNPSVRRYLDRTGNFSTFPYFYSDESEHRQNPSCGPIATFPVDFLGLAARCGLSLYVQQKFETGYGLSHRQTASYLLCCAVSELRDLFPGVFFSVPHAADSKRIELIVTLLRGGADPNMVAFDGTIWVQVLRQLDYRFGSRSLWTSGRGAFQSLEEAWIKVITAFLESDANVHEIIERSIASLVSRTGIRPKDFVVEMTIQLSALSVIEKFLGHAPGLEEIQKFFRAKGAFSYIKCLTLDFDFEGDCPNESYALSQQQSDEFLKAWDLRENATDESEEAAAFELGRVVEELHQELKSQPMESDDLPDNGEVLDEDDLNDGFDEDEDDLIDDDHSIYYSIPSTPTD